MWSTEREKKLTRSKLLIATSIDIHTFTMHVVALVCYDSHIRMKYSQGHQNYGCSNSGVPVSPTDKTAASCGNQTPYHS